MFCRSFANHGHRCSLTSSALVHHRTRFLSSIHKKMSSAPALHESAVLEQLASLPQWSYKDNKIHRQYKFANFRDAIAFIVRISFEAEQRDHHPELFNVYNRVDIALNTHDAGGRVTAKDIDLAKVIEKLSGEKKH